MDEVPKRLREYVQGIPKAELHIHIEGTLEPELMFKLAARNGIELSGTEETHRKKRETFVDLQDFLDLYYEACSVLVTERDFYDLMYAYLRRAAVDGVYVAEIFFDPQTHTERGVSFDAVINGLHRALVDGYLDFGVKGSLIMCFLRHLSEDAAMATLDQAKPHLDKFIAIGLDSGELGNPPSKFKTVYKRAADLGLKLVAHAGEEAGPEYIYEALDVLHVQRIDHGVQCLKDDMLVERLVSDEIPLTTCPNSNRKLQVIKRFFNGKDVTRRLLDRGLKITISSDDPAYFGGYITDNFLELVRNSSIDEKDVNKICRNSFESSFLPYAEKAHYLKQLHYFNVSMGYVAPPRSITMFGSRKPQQGSPEYECSYSIAKLFASKGYRVVNGGYSGLMEASSKGGSDGLATFNADQSQSAQPLDKDCAGTVKGMLAPRLFAGRHSSGNPYLTHSAISRSLSERIHKMIQESEYFIVFGGQIGTLTELMVIWNDATVRIMYGGLAQKIYVLRPALEKALGELIDTTAIYPQDVQLLTYFDTPEELFQLVEKDYHERVDRATII